MPVVEAMACGCPVLCSTRGALAEVVGEDALTADPTDVEAITRQMRRLASDVTLADRLRVAGLARARRFDWDAAAAATLQVYASLLRHPAPCAVGRPIPA